MDFDGFPVRLIGENDLPAWIQAWGSLIGIAIAVLVPTLLELLKREGEAKALAERRRGAYRTMSAVIEAIAAKQLCHPGEVEGAGKALDHLVAADFTPEGLVALVDLHERIGRAAALVTALSGRFGDHAVLSRFDSEQARTELQKCAASMGVN